jgi:hypothetical protein
MEGKCVASQSAQSEIYPLFFVRVSGEACCLRVDRNGLWPISASYWPILGSLAPVLLLPKILDCALRLRSK